MTNGNNFAITIEGKEGMFNIEKKHTWYHEHTTTESFPNELKVIKSELGKMVKKCRLMITTGQIGRYDYSYKAQTRYIIHNWMYDNAFELEVRPFNGSDFGDIKKFNFTSMPTLLKYVISDINRQGLQVLGDIPEEITVYTQKIRETETTI